MKSPRRRDGGLRGSTLILAWTRPALAARYRERAGRKTKVFRLLRSPVPRTAHPFAPSTGSLQSADRVLVSFITSDSRFKAQSIPWTLRFQPLSKVRVKTGGCARSARANTKPWAQQRRGHLLMAPRHGPSSYNGPVRFPSLLRDRFFALFLTGQSISSLRSSPAHRGSRLQGGQPRTVV